MHNSDEKLKSKMIYQINYILSKHLAMIICLNIIIIIK